MASSPRIQRQDRSGPGIRHPLRPAPVHRHHRPRQGGHDPHPPARRVGRARDVVRRLVHRGLHPHRRVRPVPHARHGDVRGDPVAARIGTARDGARHLRRVHAQRRAVRRRPPLRAASPGRAGEEPGLRRQLRPGAGVLPVPPLRGRLDRAAAARSGRLLRLLDRPRAGDPPGHGRRARGVRHQGRGGPPRGRRRAARDRLRVLRRAHDGRQRGHVQVRAQGHRPAARAVRDVHAQADPRHQRLRHACPPIAVVDRGGAQRLRRCHEPVRAVRRRALVHGRDPRPRPRA